MRMWLLRYMRRFRFHSAFSLVEVTLAMGVFVFALVALLGVLPAAMRSSRASLDMATASQIADAMGLRLQTGDWSSPVYFDDIGNETSTATEAVYQADVEKLPSISDSLARAEITVSRQGANATKRYFPYLVFDNL